MRWISDPVRPLGCLDGDRRSHSPPQKDGGGVLGFWPQPPDDYDLMFVIRAPMQADEESEGQWTCGFRTYGLLQQTIVDCQKAGYLQGHDPNALSFMVWSTVHGMVSLVIRDRLKMYNHDIRHQLGQTAIHSLNQLLRSWDS